MYESVRQKLGHTKGLGQASLSGAHHVTVIGISSVTNKQKNKYFCWHFDWSGGGCSECQMTTLQHHRRKQRIWTLVVIWFRFSNPSCSWWHNCCYSIIICVWYFISILFKVSWRVVPSYFWQWKQNHFRSMTEWMIDVAFTMATNKGLPMIQMLVTSAF